MASAQSTSSGSSPAQRAGTEKPSNLPVRRRLLPITIFLAVLIGVAALGTMFLVMFGVWPVSETQTREPNPTAEAIKHSGLTAEKAGEPRIEGNQVYAPVKVTNNYHASVSPPGTPTPGLPTPTPSDVNVKVAFIRVLFYGEQTGSGPLPIVGSAEGQAIDIPFGQSKTVEVVGINVPPFADWEPIITGVEPAVTSP